MQIHDLLIRLHARHVVVSCWVQLKTFALNCVYDGASFSRWQRVALDPQRCNGARRRDLLEPEPGRELLLAPYRLQIYYAPA